jgi:hypothetical protein
MSDNDRVRRTGPKRVRCSDDDDDEYDDDDDDNDDDVNDDTNHRDNDCDG